MTHVSDSGPARFGAASGVTSTDSAIADREQSYQIAWGSVFAGAAVALVAQLILNMIGLGIGLSTVDAVAGDNPSAGAASIGAGLWFVVSGLVASALGGYLAGRLSGKISPSTTAYHGLISWAVTTIVLVYMLSSAATGIIGGATSAATSAASGAGSAISGSLKTAVQAAAPSANSAMTSGADPMAAIESQIRSNSGGQDPAALRDTAMASIKAALSGNPAEQAAANDRAAEALARAQGIPVDQAKAQVAQYTEQYKAAVANAKETAKKAADATAKTVSRGSLLAALALLLGALAAFFAGQAGANTRLASSRDYR